MKEGTVLVALLLCLAVGGCATDGGRSLVDLPNETAGYAPLFKSLFPLVDEMLARNGQALRPFCLVTVDANRTIGKWTRHDPPEAVMSALSEREVFAGSECSERGLSAPDGRASADVWVEEFDLTRSDSVRMGFGVNTLWIRAYKCSVEAAGDELSVGECQLLYKG